MSEAMTEPNDDDRVAAVMLWNADWNDSAYYATVIEPLFVEHFSAHRIAAEKAERKRIAKWLRFQWSRPQLLPYSMKRVCNQLADELESEAKHEHQ